jgi:hypothetical protein
LAPAGAVAAALAESPRWLALWRSIDIELDIATGHVRRIVTSEACRVIVATAILLAQCEGCSGCDGGV